MAIKPMRRTRLTALLIIQLEFYNIGTITNCVIYSRISDIVMYTSQPMMDVIDLVEYYLRK
jgi:hypothetical protein